MEDKAYVRLFVECDLQPILGIEVAEGDDLSAEAASMLRERYAERIATAVGNVLKEDIDVSWHNEVFEIRVAFTKPIIEPFLKDKGG